MRITISNEALGTRAKINLPDDGLISRKQASAARRRLGTPPGMPDAGPLGEVGPQKPPEQPGWIYTFRAVEDGDWILATPARDEAAAQAA